MINRQFLFIISAIFLLSVPSVAVDSYEDTVMQIIIDSKLHAINDLAADPIIVGAVLEQNSMEVSLAEIKKIDREWSGGGQQEFAMGLQKNKAGSLLKKHVTGNRLFYSEAFLCDNQGAVVGEYPKTSDYWQGDEEKFTAPFNGGQGKIFIGPLEYDESSRTHSVQVSVPVKDGEKTIGVLIVGIRNIQ